MDDQGEHRDVTVDRPAAAAGATPCMSCGSPLAVRWSTRDGAAWLCRECAVLHGLGCP